ncbi:hypothetical protein ABT297_24215 [Dactylosporangium sp. NPDC000555]|uniref:hypothetical protein n=1 Tax=Dactylosporangium sp. NPDC000555 TaxID=3154260 RepID=UPI00331F66DC
MVVRSVVEQAVQHAAEHHQQLDAERDDGRHAQQCAQRGVAEYGRSRHPPDRWQEGHVKQ